MRCFLLYLHKRFQKLRTLKQISRQDLAKGIVSYSHLCNFESGRHNLSDDIIKALADKLGVPAEYFLAHNIRSRRLNEFLSNLVAFLKNNSYSEAENVIYNIEVNYPYINSTFQETCFYILKSYFLFKIQRASEAIALVTDEIMYLVEEKDLKYFTDPYFIESYYYVLATTYLRNKEYIKSYDFFLKYMNYASSDLSKADAYYNLSVSSYRMNHLSNAISLAKEALEIYLDELAWVKIFDSHNFIGCLYLEDKSLDLAESHFLKALDVAKKMNLNNLLEKIYHNLGLLYKVYKNFDAALEYLYMSLDLKKQSKNNPNITYYAIINIYIKKLDIKKAEDILSEAQAICTNESDYYFCKELSASICFHKGEYHLYETYMKEAFDYFYKVKNKKEISYICNNLGEYYKSLRKYKKACYFYQSAFDILKL